MPRLTRAHDLPSVLPLLFLLVVSGTPPRTWPGHTLYGDGNSRITVDVFGDYQCPYTAKAWPTVVSALPKLMNASELRVRYHLYEILHHRNAYEAALAGYVTTAIMAEQGKDVFRDVSSNLLAQQQKFFNGATANATRLQVSRMHACLRGPACRRVGRCVCRPVLGMRVDMYAGPPAVLRIHVHMNRHRCLCTSAHVYTRFYAYIGARVYVYTRACEYPRG